jgi:hypothetical protein
LKGVTTGQIARKKPMSQDLPLQSEEEDGASDDNHGGSEEKSTSENDVRGRLEFNGKEIIS